MLLAGVLISRGMWFCCSSLCPFRSQVFVVMASRGQGNYMPLCRCGRILTDMRSVDEQTRWGERFDVSWGYRLNETAYWFYCLPCHRKIWPHDRRVIGRYSRPAPKHLNLYLPNAAVGASRLACGDYFYLTTAAPEWLPDASDAEARRVRARVAAPLAVSGATAAAAAATGTLLGELLAELQGFVVALAAIVVAANNYCSGRSGRPY